MRLVLAIHHFLPAFHAGSEQHAYQVVREMHRRGYDVRVVCIERIDADSGAEITWQDDVYDDLPVRRLSFNLAAAPDPRRWEYDNPLIGDHLRTFLSEVRPDVLHLFSGYLMTGQALHAAYQLAIPTVVTLTDFWFLCPRITLLQSNGGLSAPPFDPVTCARCLGEEQRRYRLPGRFFPRAMRWFWSLRRDRVRALAERQKFLGDTLQQVDRLLAPSEFLRNLFIAQGIPPSRIDLCRQGIAVPPDLGTRAPRLRRLPLQIGYIGQLAEQKGVDVLIAAMRRLADAPITLRLYGNPNQFPAYTARLRQLAGHDPRIELAGTYRGAAERRAVLDSFDVIVVPSVWYENNPMSINEALGHGLPVVTSNLGSMPEAVSDGINGLLFRRGDDADLARQLRRLVDEPDLLARLQAGITPRPSVADEVNQVTRVYQQLLAARRPA
jgi:glycosyltransferase involved in cell wall biosynthesis